MQFNPLSIDEIENFKHTFNNFKNKSDDLESALAKQFNLALDDCQTATQFLKLLVVLGSVIYRPIIRKQIFDRFEDVIAFIDEEIKEVRAIAKQFEQDVESTGKYSYIDPSFPASNGNLICLRQLKSRISDPVQYTSLMHFK